MSIFNTVKRFLSGQQTELAWSNSSVVAVTESTQSGTGPKEWEVTIGSLQHPRQECRISYSNSLISGTCTGTVGALTGSAMIGFFEDLPIWLPSLLVRVTVQVGEGELTVSTREPGGTLVQMTAPGTLEANAELVNGRAWLRCEAGLVPARSISYEAVII